jgi:hypothetical protein
MALTALTMLLAIVPVQNAHAQVELTLGGGVNSPMGEYGDVTKVGYALTGGLGYRVFHMAVFGVEATYNGNGAKDHVLEDLGTGYDLSSSMLQYAAVAKFIFPVSKHSVFAKGSVGNYRGTAKLEGPLTDESVSVTDLGFGIGGGIMLNSSKNSSLFADLTYNNVTFDGADSATEFLTFTVGALIRFDLNKSDIEEEARGDLDRLND